QPLTYPTQSCHALSSSHHPAPTYSYPLSLHDALPICRHVPGLVGLPLPDPAPLHRFEGRDLPDHPRCRPGVLPVLVLPGRCDGPLPQRQRQTDPPTRGRAPGRNPSGEVLMWTNFFIHMDGKTVEYGLKLSGTSALKVLRLLAQTSRSSVYGSQMVE